MVGSANFDGVQAFLLGVTEGFEHAHAVRAEVGLVVRHAGGPYMQGFVVKKTHHDPQHLIMFLHADEANQARAAFHERLERRGG